MQDRTDGTLGKSDYNPTGSSKSMGDYGSTASDVEARRVSMRKDSSGTPGKRRQSRSDPRFLKHMSCTTTTDKVFDRQASNLSSVASGRSLASRGSRTRLTSVSRSEYHDDLEPQLRAAIVILGNILSAEYQEKIDSNTPPFLMASKNHQITIVSSRELSLHLLDKITKVLLLEFYRKFYSWFVS